MRVRCRGVWHEVRVTGGRLQVPHDDAELARERVLESLGGRIAGCAAAERAWHTGVGRLPKALRAQRTEFFEWVRHGDTGAVLAYLDGGFDPHVRDGAGRTLLHHLAFLDAHRMLPRLLREGLEVNAPDRHGRTPLHEAVTHQDIRAVKLLLDAGADPLLRDETGQLATEVQAWADPEGRFRGLMKQLLP